MRRTGTWSTSACVIFLHSPRDRSLALTRRAHWGLCPAHRVSRRVERAASSWRRPRSFRRGASLQKTRGSGRTHRSRLSSGSSTLRTRREPRLASSSGMRAARHRHSPRGSSRARIARTELIPQLPLPTRGDGQITVRYAFPAPLPPHQFRCLLTCRARSLWARDYSLVGSIPNSQGDDRDRYAARHGCVCSRSQAGCSGGLYASFYARKPCSSRADRGEFSQSIS